MNGMSDLVETFVLVQLELSRLIKRVSLEKEPDLVTRVQEVPILSLEKNETRMF